MRDVLAERLLAKVMNWDEMQLAKENSELQIFSEYKYDKYQQFFPGMKFIESLSLWLNQFNDNEKLIAYEFVKNKIIFFSLNELNHIIEMTFHDSIKPFIIKQISDELKINEYRIKEILSKNEYKILKRQSLFLGLSDGARTDFFRRVSELSHEQIHSTYMIGHVKSEDLLKELSKDLDELGSKIDKPKFRTVFLIDDFSASGISCLRKENDRLKGKISKFLDEIMNSKSEIFKLVNTSDLKIYVVLYLATTKAASRIKDMANQILKSLGISVQVIIAHEISDSVVLNEKNLGEFLKIR